MNEWIPVLDHYPPTDGTAVIARTRFGFLFVGRYDGKDYRGMDQWKLLTEKSSYHVAGKVTHWMHKPPDPVAQSAEATDLSSVQCEFDSHPDHHKEEAT